MRKPVLCLFNCLTSQRRNTRNLFKQIPQGFSYQYKKVGVRSRATVKHVGSLYGPPKLEEHPRKRRWGSEVGLFCMVFTKLEENPKAGDQDGISVVLYGSQNLKETPRQVGRSGF